MTDNKSYLMRAIHEWICDNKCTPYLYVDTAQPNVVIPEHLYGDNPLVLNISPSASQSLLIDDVAVSFQARFSGKVFNLFIPIPACLAIIARENGQGMSFERQTAEQPVDEQSTEAATSETESKTSKKTHLKVIR